MLIIISDLHLTDGSTGESISTGAFRHFRDRLESMAFYGSKRSAEDRERYQPIQSLDLILLGDIFDLIRSTAWTESGNGGPATARPWDDPQDPHLIRKLNQITDRIIEHNQDSLAILRGLSNATEINLPPATAAGKVDERVSRDRRSPSRLPLQVNIHYLVGNHDWMFHLPGPEYDRLRAKVIGAMGLANPATPFPHDPAESSRIMDLYRRHQVFGRHGDIFDSFNFVEDRGRDFPSVGDALVVELFNVFPDRVEAELGAELPPQLFADMRELGNIRPVVMTPVWLGSVFARHQLSKRHQRIIDEIWDELVDNLLRSDFLRRLDTPSPFDLIDKLEFFFRVTRPLSVTFLEKLAPTLARVEEIYEVLSGGGVFAFENQAAREAAYQSKEARFIVYGHTHGYKVHPLRATEKNGEAFDQMYINSGTWHPLHELGKEEKTERGFVSYDAMTILGFYHGDEREGRSFETWSGTLDL